jgi:hypothetical protein
MDPPRQPGRPPTGGPPPDDQQPSAQIAMAAWMLRHGHHPTRVAAVTDVPLALVQLIADNLPPDTGHHQRSLPRKTDPPRPDHNDQRQTTQDPTGQRWEAITRTHTAQLRRRRRIRVLQSAVICAASTPPSPPPPS